MQVQAGSCWTHPALISEVIYIALEKYSVSKRYLIKVQYVKFTAFFKCIFTAPFPSLFAGAQIYTNESHDGYNYSAV